MEGGKGLSSAAAVAERIKAVAKISQSLWERALRCSWDAAGSLAVIGEDNMVGGPVFFVKEDVFAVPSSNLSEKKDKDPNLMAHPTQISQKVSSGEQHPYF